MPKEIDVRPVLKASDDGSPRSFIYFDEPVDLPTGQSVNISLHFERENSFDEIKQLISLLKQKGMRFVAQEVE